MDIYTKSDVQVKELYNFNQDKEEKVNIDTK